MGEPKEKKSLPWRSYPAEPTRIAVVGHEVADAPTLRRIHLVPDAEWRAGLQRGDPCDLLVNTADLDPDSKEHAEVDGMVSVDWREARIFEVRDDGRLLVGCREPQGYTVTLERASERIEKPYEKVRDWRAELQPGWKVEIHVDLLAMLDGVHPSDEPPVYSREAGLVDPDHLIYYIPRYMEWWVGTWIRQRNGYFLADRQERLVESPDLLEIHESEWEYYDPNVCENPYGWNPGAHLKISVHTPGQSPEDFPEAIELSGHTGYQTSQLGVYHRTRWVMAEVERVDTSEGMLDIAIRSQVTKGAEGVRSVDLLQGVGLYGDLIAKPGTHVALPSAGTLDVLVKTPLLEGIVGTPDPVKMSRSAKFCELATRASGLLIGWLNQPGFAAGPYSFKRIRKDGAKDSALLFGDRTLIELGIKSGDIVIVSAYWSLQNHRYFAPERRLWVADIFRIAARAREHSFFLPAEMWIAILECLLSIDLGAPVVA